MLTDLVNGRLDLAICAGRPRRRGIVSEPWFDEELVLVAGSGLAGELGAPLDPGTAPAALAGAPLIAYDEEHSVLCQYWSSVFDAELDHLPDLVVPDLRGMLTAVAAGTGISVLPRQLCSAGFAAGTLTVLCEPEIPPINTLYLARRAGPIPFAGLRDIHQRLRLAARDW